MPSVSNINQKYQEIYQDLSTNVTRLHGRFNMHLAVDLIYHTPLQFYFKGLIVPKGWGELFIIGDTRSGKSEIAKRLVQHYALGEIAQAEGATFAGLVGGLSQMNGRWSIGWGKIPLNNKRLIFIDELTGIKPEEIENMSSIRSTGVAELTKIHSERTQAKTRLIWMSNSQSGLSVSNFANGINLVRDVFKKPEDIARLDMIIVLARNDVADDVVNYGPTETVEHIHTSELCKNIVLWAWSREPEHIRIEGKTADACLDLAKAMYNKYSAEFPLVTSSEQKYKLAKLGSALAMRLFSTEDGENVIVLPEHIEYVYNFMCNEFDGKYFAYDVWSKNRLKESNIKDPREITALMERMGVSACASLLDMVSIKLNDISEITACPHDEARTKLSVLVRNNALKKRTTDYVKTPAFIEILKQYLHKAEVSSVPIKEEY